MNKLLAGALIAALTATTACSGSNRAARAANPAPCPNIVVLAEAARFVEFDGQETLDDVAYSGEITNVSTSCRYFEDRPIDQQLDISFAFGKGPKGAEGEKYFKYWVAVTRKDREVIAKKEFIVPADFKDERVVVVTTEEVDKIVIPRHDAEVSGLNFEIIVGFSVTPEQAIFNRSGKSLKFPHLK